MELWQKVVLAIVVAYLLIGVVGTLVFGGSPIDVVLWGPDFVRGFVLETNALRS